MIAERAQREARSPCAVPVMSTFCFVNEPHEQLRAESEEDDAERELFVEARAERHDEADEATLVLDAGGPAKTLPTT